MADHRVEAVTVRHRVLVVAGNVILRGRLYDALTRHGCVVKTVFSSERALASLQHERPDLLLMDLSGFDLESWCLPDRIRAFDDELPIIVLGDHQDAPPDARLLRDIQAFLSRDISEVILLATVSRWLAPSSVEDEARGTNRGTALVIDDEPELLETLRDFLEVRGYAVCTARSGEEGLERLAQCRPTVALLDIKMPGMDGLLTLKKLKELRPALPVIMATGVQGEELMTQAFAFGAYDYVMKPYNLRALETTLARLGRLLGHASSV